MDTVADPIILLFSYGTLRQAEVQRATYGRLLTGTADTLSGYRLEPLQISDPAVVRLSGKAVHSIACFTGDRAERIDGIVFRITPDELAATDAYEVDAYARIAVTLDSGISAFAYVGPPKN